MSKVSGRTGSQKRIGQTRSPDTGFLKKRAFEKQTLPEPPRLQKPQVYISGRSPLKGFYYPKTVRGKWHTADRVTRGTRWNAYLCSGTAIPKGTAPEIFRAPPTVSGLLSSMRTAQKHHAAEPLIHHTHHHAHSSHVLHPRTIHSRSSLDTGWLDVPMPGALTEFQQGTFMHLNPVRHHSSHVPLMARQPQALTAIISMRTVPFEIAKVQQQANIPKLQQAAQNAQPTHSISLAETRTPAVVQNLNIQIIECVKSPARPDFDIPLPTHFSSMNFSSSKPARLHFNSVHVEKQQPKTVKFSPAVAKPANPKPQGFSSEVPRSEELRAAPETVQAVTKAAEIRTHRIRFDGIPTPGHVGYIPSVRKKEKQLKVALGAEGIPPQ